MTALTGNAKEQVWNKLQ